MTKLRRNWEEELPVRLKLARLKLGLSAAQLAAEIGSAEPTIRDYERGKSIPGGRVIAELCLLGINPIWLLTAQGPMFTRELDRPAPPVDVELLRAVIDGIEAHLESEQIELPPTKMAQLVSLLYEQCAMEGEVRPATILRLVKLAA